MESESLVILSGSLVILSAAKDLALGRQMLHYAQHDTTGPLVILSGSLVILSAAKDLALGRQMLHYASARHYLLACHPERSEGSRPSGRPFAQFPLSAANGLRMTRGDCSNGQGPFFKLNLA